MILGLPPYLTQMQPQQSPAMAPPAPISALAQQVAAQGANGSGGTAPQMPNLGALQQILAAQQANNGPAGGAPTGYSGISPPGISPGGAPATAMQGQPLAGSANSAFNSAGLPDNTAPPTDPTIMASLAKLFGTNQ